MVGNLDRTDIFLHGRASELVPKRVDVVEVLLEEM